MADYSVTRRRFLGSVLAALPLLRTPLAWVRVKEAEYVVAFTSEPFREFVVTAFTNGGLAATLGGLPMESVSDGGWTTFSLRADELIGQLVVKRPEPNELWIDWLAQYSPNMQQHVEHDYLPEPCPDDGWMYVENTRHPLKNDVACLSLKPTLTSLSS